MTPRTLRTLRQLHHYIGVFLAPAILFFAISGGLQTFRLQQASGWDGAPPPAWMAWAGSVHIDQRTPEAEADKSPPKRPPPTPAEATARAARQAAVLPMKVFTVLVAIGLAGSTLVGVVIALSSRAMRRRSLALLAAGALLPLLLLLA